MKELFRTVLYRVFVPALLALTAEELYPFLKPRLWHGLAAVIPSLAELAHFAAMAGIASILAEEVLKHALVPVARELSQKEFVPALGGGFDKIRDVLATGLWEKGLLIREQLTIEREPETAQLQKDLGQDPALEKAKQFIIEGHLEKAIDLLDRLAAKKPEHRLHLLSALLSSPKAEDWQRANNLLSEGIGAPNHYMRLAYNHWVKGDFTNAVAIAEQGFNRIEAEELTASEEDVDRFKNTLAYYYADANLIEKGDLALSLADAAVIHRSPGGESRTLGSALATRGYAKITFGRSRQDIVEGMKDCEDGRRMGAREDLYFRHLARAQERLAKMT